MTVFIEHAELWEFEAFNIQLISDPLSGPTRRTHVVYLALSSYFRLITTWAFEHLRTLLEQREFSKHQSNTYRNSLICFCIVSVSKIICHVYWEARFRFDNTRVTRNAYEHCLKGQFVWRQCNGYFHSVEWSSMQLTSSLSGTSRMRASKRAGQTCRQKQCRTFQSSYESSPFSELVLSCSFEFLCQIESALESSLSIH